jgi:hypothetical protein
MPPRGAVAVTRAAELTRQRRDQSVAPGLVQHPHLADVALELTIADQLGDRRLTSPDRPCRSIADAASAPPRRSPAGGAIAKPSRSPGARTFDSVPM